MNSSRRSRDSSYEESPLFPPKARHSDDGFGEAQSRTAQLDWEEPSTVSKSSWYLFILTLSIGGLQIVWSVELSNGSPYLLSLGMSKSLLAFVWIAGPLSGVLVQPYIGIRSDNCRISWGKRKPFMIGGGIATVLSLMLLAWIQEIIRGFLALFGVAPDSAATRGTIIFFATVAMCVLDFAINTIQAGIRAFIVDNAPAHQQESANAWASRVVGVGNVLGYIFGYIDLPRYFPFFGNTQFKVLCVVASLSLGSTLLVSCLYIKERDPRLEPPSVNGNPGVVDFFRQVFRSTKRLSPQIRKVCEVQFFSWIGWFPFLFYITTYIGQLYVNPYLKPDLSEDEIDNLWEKATRVGTFALLLYAIVSLLANFILPFIVEPSSIAKQGIDKTDFNGESTSCSVSHRSRQSSHGSLSFSVSRSNLDPYPTAVVQPTNSFVSRYQTFISRQLSRLRISYLTLRRVWILSHVFFAICMFSTFFIFTPTAGIIMASFVGISWSVTLWIPFALISAELAQQDEARQCQLRHLPKGVGRQVRGESSRSRGSRIEVGNRSDLAEPPTRYNNNVNFPESDHEDKSAAAAANDRTSKRTISSSSSSSSSSSPSSPLLPLESNQTSLQTSDNHHDHPSSFQPHSPLEAQDLDPDPDPDRAGTILGLHNVAISGPQILSTLISSVVFFFLQRDRHVPGDTSVGWILRIGGLTALVAAWWGARVGEPERG